MKKTLLAAAAIVAAVMALAPLGAQASTAPAPHRINLHAAFGRALRAAPVNGRVAGVVPPVGRRITAARPAAATTCTEPNCNLTYGGGAVESAPRVYLLLWGPNWTPADPVSNDLSKLYSGLGSSSDSWSTVTNQYGPAFSGSVFMGTFNDIATPPAVVGYSDLSAEADAFATSQGIAGDVNAQVVIASQSGTCFDTSDGGFAGSCGSPGSGAYCAWHSYDGLVAFTNLPYMLDAGAICGENWINRGSNGLTDGVSIIAGHEYAETATDPEPTSGWADNADTISGGEVGDKCAWGGTIWGSHDAQGNVTLATGTFAMQSLWSNAAGRCILTTSPVVSITRPRNQQTILNHRVILRMHASTNSGFTVTFRASHLPTGLHIGPAGLITGKATRLGRWVVTVTATTYGAHKSTSFIWKVIR